LSTPEELLELIEPYLDDLALTPEVGELERSMRYALAGGGKREVARRRDAIFHMRMNAANGVVGL